jgi:hypothetical protein
LRRPILVNSLLIARDAVRPVILVICTVALLIGLPRLAVFFRKPQDFGNINVILDAPGKRAPEVRHDGSPTFAAVKEPVVQTSPTKPALPANEADLIVAIQQELARIGYYGGPITSAWTEGVRGAIRKFSGSGRTKPSQQLLTALRATKPEIKAVPANQGATFNLQAAQDLINGRVPATLVNTPDDGLLSEGYLPPWKALRERYNQIAQSLPPGAGTNGALTLRVTARSSRMESRRHERISRRHYVSVRRRARFSPYGGYFAY